MKLPLTCQADYFENFISREEADAIYTHLIQDIALHELQPVLSNAGKIIVLDTGKIMFMDQALRDSNALPEAIWGKTAVWTSAMKSLKTKIEKIVDRTFGVCVAIHYPDGSTGVSYHSDHSAYGDTSVIASISLGEEREFLLRNIASQLEHRMVLAHGSMLVMGEGCQELYEHSLPVNDSYKNARINLTFRQWGY